MRLYITLMQRSSISTVVGEDLPATNVTRACMAVSHEGRGYLVNKPLPAASMSADNVRG